MTFRRNRCDRLTRLGGDDARAFELRSTRRRGYCRVTMIAGKRKRRIFRGLLRVACLIRRSSYVMLFARWSAAQVWASWSFRRCRH